CRAKKDLPMLKNLITTGTEIKYFPDISVYLMPSSPMMVTATTTDVAVGANVAVGTAGGASGAGGIVGGAGVAVVTTSTLLPSTKLPKLGVFLTRNIYRKNKNYPLVVQKLAHALTVLSERFVVNLIPFNTFTQNKNECDLYINRDVYNAVDSERAFTLLEMREIFSEHLDFAITMRYHSHMYAITTNTPFVSMFTTSKVGNLLADSNTLEYSYRLPVDSINLPIDFDVDRFLAVFDHAWHHRAEIQERFRVYLTLNVDLSQFENTVGKFMTTPNTQHPTPTTLSVRTTTLPVPTTTLSVPTITPPVPTTTPQLTGVKKVVFEMVEFLIDNYSQGEAGNKIGGALDLTAKLCSNQLTFCSLFQAFGVADTDIDFLAGLASYRITNIPFSKYYYGLREKIRLDTFRVKDELKWVLDDHHHLLLLQQQQLRESNNNSNSNGPFMNAKVVSVNDFDGCHRNGWQYVVNGILQFHKDDDNISTGSLGNNDGGLVLDNYVDRTFLWCNRVYEYAGVIPFRRKWRGFIHHTLDQTQSEYNCITLFQTATFLNSLPYCTGLYVLSEYLQAQILVLHSQAGYTSIPVFALIHPTELVSLTWTMDRFQANPSPKLVQVGAWMRDTSAIYFLTLHNTNLRPLKKAALKEANMDNYFPPEGFEFKLCCTGSSQPESECKPKPNQFVVGLENWGTKFLSSVEIIQKVTNDSYDVLLSENIVFFKLIDASATRFLNAL
ncbi:UNVERIFIED_CONTAM: hypothetical protein HDU68_004708, partial [Siphonaria sp. JEL0065]